MKPLTLGAGHLWILMSPWRMDVKWYMKCFIYWIADLKSSKPWSSQLWTQFKQLRREAWKSQERRTGIARSGVQTPLKSWLFQASLRNCLNCVHNCDDHGLLVILLSIYCISLAIIKSVLIKPVFIKILRNETTFYGLYRFYNNLLLKSCQAKSIYA